MLRTVLLLSVCGLVRSSGVIASSVPVAQVTAVGPAPAPVVTASSSQYFERTFNRLIVPPVVSPIGPVVPPPPTPVPVAPATTVFIEPTQQIPVAVNPPPPQEVQPNIAIAIATAHAAAPVATILLPPYPFGFPPGFGLVPSEQPINVPDENTKEPTTQRTSETEATTPEPESTTPIDASSSDNNFVQALPSNENVNFHIYGPPSVEPKPQVQQPGSQFRPQQQNPQFQPQQPQFYQQQNQQFKTQQPNPKYPPQQPQYQPKYPPYPPKQQRPTQFQPQVNPQQYQPRPQQPWPQQKGRPQKLKTSVEVVPVPLHYITPPPLQKTHAHVKVVKHIYSFVPASSDKIILKPVKIRPVKLIKRKIVRVRPQNLRANARDIEITTFNPFPRPNTKPPRA